MKKTSTPPLAAHRARSTRTRKVTVYRYKSRWPQPDFLPAWGTREAIAMLDGCIPLAASARNVAPSALDGDGFVTLDAEPDARVERP